MLFNSVEFAVFLPIVFSIYWLLNKKSLRSQNFLLLLASYFFYACWDWRFLFLLVFSTLLDYFSGLQIENSTTDKRRKGWLILSIGINLGFLAVFKYYNFFIESFSAAFSVFGIQFHPTTLNIILPVGISFYTFHGLSYIIDVYKKRINAERNLTDYSLFVSFFPLLVAGPIERATHLLPQIKQKRQFDYSKAVDGMRQILWGLFKKIVIADASAGYANQIFQHYEDYSGGMLIIGAVLFAFQIYGDFSGYSDIALGTARLFGFELLQNFSFPYFSRDIAEFWRRWHISLSSWFRDYVYIPLGGSKGSLSMKIRNTFIIFSLSGLWHGANWTFIVWGLLNALYYLPLLITQKNKSNTGTIAAGKSIPSFKEFSAMLLTFALTTFAWIFFRADNLSHACNYIKTIFTNIFKPINIDSTLLPLLLVIGFFLLVEWKGREHKFAIQGIAEKKPKLIRYFFYYTILLLILLFGGKEQQFIYFQF